MYISQAMGYALHGLTSLSSCPEGALIYASDIAQSIGASESYLAKVFQMLARAGLVASERGVKGGYGLARPADQITVREVMEAVDGRFPETICLFHDQTDSHCPACPVITVVDRAYRRMLEELDGMTIEELAPSLFAGTTLTPRQAATAVSVSAPPATGSAQIT